MSTKTYSRSRLARLYKVHRHTIANWIASNPRLQHLSKLRRNFFAKEVELIKSEIGDWE